LNQLNISIPGKNKIFLEVSKTSPRLKGKYSCGSTEFWVARSLEIFSRTFCCFVVIEILLHAYFEYFLDIEVEHMFSNNLAE